MALLPLYDDLTAKSHFVLPKTMKLPGTKALLLLLLATSSPVAGEKKSEGISVGTKRNAAVVKVLGTADRMEIRMPHGKDSIHVVSGKEKLSELFQAIEINDTRSGFYCACHGDFHLHFYAGKAKLGVIGYHHNRSLRWHAGMWKGDSLLTGNSATELIKWFSKNGFNRPAEDRKAKLERIAKEKKRDETFINCFQKSSHRHLEYADLPDLNHDDKTVEMGRRLRESYADPVAFLKDACRALGSKPAPMNHWSFPDQIGREATCQLGFEVFSKLLERQQTLSDLEKEGLIYSIRTHPDSVLKKLTGQEADLCKVLARALETELDSEDVSRTLLWVAENKVSGSADVISPFVVGKKSFSCLVNLEGSDENPSPEAIAALALGLLEDDRVVKPAEKRLAELSDRSPERSALRLAVALAKGQCELFELTDSDWDTWFLHRAVIALANRFPSKHSYDLVAIGNTRAGWALIREEAVIEFQKLSGQKWYQGGENERADWYGKDVREWWERNRETFEFPKR